MPAPIPYEQRRDQLTTLTPVQLEQEEPVIIAESEECDHYIQALEIQKQLDEEARSPTTESQMVESEAVNRIQIGGAPAKKITFHVGRTYHLFEKTFVHKEIIPDEKTNNLELVINSLKDPLLKEIHDLLEIHHGIKGWTAIEMEYINPPDITPFIKYIRTKVHTISNEWELDDLLRDMAQIIITRNIEMIRDKSQLTILSSTSVQFKFSQWTPLAGRGFIEAPSFLMKKKCLGNVKNNDDKCLGYAICAFRLHQRWLDQEKKKRD